MLFVHLIFELIRTAKIACEEDILSEFHEENILSECHEEDILSEFCEEDARKEEFKQYTQNLIGYGGSVNPFEHFADFMSFEDTGPANELCRLPEEDAVVKYVNDCWELTLMEKLTGSSGIDKNIIKEGNNALNMEDPLWVQEGNKIIQRKVKKDKKLEKLMEKPEVYDDAFWAKEYAIHKSNNKESGTETKIPAYLDVDFRPTKEIINEVVAKERACPRNWARNIIGLHLGRNHILEKEYSFENRYLSMMKKYNSKKYNDMIESKDKPNDVVSLLSDDEEKLTDIKLKGAMRSPVICNHEMLYKSNKNEIINPFGYSFANRGDVAGNTDEDILFDLNIKTGGSKMPNLILEEHVTDIHVLPKCKTTLKSNENFDYVCDRNKIHDEKSDCLVIGFCNELKNNKLEIQRSPANILPEKHNKKVLGDEKSDSFDNMNPKKLIREKINKYGIKVIKKRQQNVKNYNSGYNFELYIYWAVVLILY